VAHGLLATTQLRQLCRLVESSARRQFRYIGDMRAQLRLKLHPMLRASLLLAIAACSRCGVSFDSMLGCAQWLLSSCQIDVTLGGGMSAALPAVRVTVQQGRLPCSGPAAEGFLCLTVTIPSTQDAFLSTPLLR